VTDVKTVRPVERGEAALSHGAMLCRPCLQIQVNIAFKTLFIIEISAAEMELFLNSNLVSLFSEFELQRVNVAIASDKPG